MTGEASPIADGGDLRLGMLTTAVLALFHERAEGLPVPAILGVLAIVRHQLLTQAFGE